jgi:hypothetical protein
MLWSICNFRVGLESDLFKLIHRFLVGRLVQVPIWARRTSVTPLVVCLVSEHDINEKLKGSPFLESSRISSIAL